VSVGPAGRTASPARPSFGAAIRFLARVLIVSGVLLLADAGTTLAWQEPVSALLTAREQSELEEQLESLPAPRRAGQLGAARLEALADRWERRTGRGEAFGRIELPTLERDYAVVEGTDQASLHSGPGHYPETGLPGQPGTVGIAGHRTTYLAPFRTIDELERGDEIVVEMPYARFTYRVQKQQIVEPSQTEVVDDVGYPRLVLSACHPLYSAAQRIVVFARLDEVRPA